MCGEGGGEGGGEGATAIFWRLFLRFVSRRRGEGATAIFLAFPRLVLLVMVLPPKRIPECPCYRLFILESNTNF